MRLLIQFYFKSLKINNANNSMPKNKKCFINPNLINNLDLFI